MLCTLFLVLLAATLALHTALPNHGPTVHTQQGTLIGTYYTSRYGRNFAAFQGIPYAQPPIGDLRFKVKAIFFKSTKYYCYIFGCKTKVNLYATEGFRRGLRVVYKFLPGVIIILWFTLRP